MECTYVIEYVNDIYNAYVKNHQLLTDRGYTLLSPQVLVNKQYIADNSDSIYHYHGSCADIVDEEQKVINTNNLYKTLENTIDWYIENDSWIKNVNRSYDNKRQGLID